MYLKTTSVCPSINISRKKDLPWQRRPSLEKLKSPRFTNLLVSAIIPAFSGPLKKNMGCLRKSFGICRFQFVNSHKKNGQLHPFTQTMLLTRLAAIINGPLIPVSVLSFRKVLSLFRLRHSLRLYPFQLRLCLFQQEPPSADR